MKQGDSNIGGWKWGDLIETSLRVHRLSITHTQFVRVVMTCRAMPDRTSAIAVATALLKFYAVPAGPDIWDPICIL